jgi:hypothetical protein
MSVVLVGGTAQNDSSPNGTSWTALPIRSNGRINTAASYESPRRVLIVVCFTVAKCETGTNRQDSGVISTPAF